MDASARPTTERRGASGVTDRAAARIAVTLAVAASPILLATLFEIRGEFTSEVYLPLHALVEFFICFVGFATFAVQWYAASAPGVHEARGRLLGAAALGMALLEVAHFLVFPGMPGFLGPSSAERAIHYWLGARTLLTCALVASAWIPAASEARVLRRGTLTSLAVAFVAGWVVIEASLPPEHGLLHASGIGLTRLKVAMEVGLGALAGAGAVLHLRRHRATGDATLLRTAAALGWLVLASICLTSYTSAYDTFNLLGHAYAAGSFWILFDALFVAALLRPYEWVEATTHDLAQSNARLEELREHVEGELAATIARLEETSRAAEQARYELEAAVAAVPDGILRYGPDGEILWMNAGAERLLHYEGAAREQPIAARWAALAPRTTDGERLDVEDSPIARALRGETVEGVPIVITPPGGRPRWVNVSAAAVHATGGLPAGAVATVTDVSELQELQAEREDLLRAVSHDLRNPLQIVLLQGERIHRLAAADALKERKAAAAICAAAKQMSVMIYDLVEAVRLEAQRLKLAREPIDLGRWLGERLSHQAGVLDIGRVELALGPGLPPVLADASRLERIVTNLVGNALKYSAPPAPVKVSTALRDDFVVVSVSDRGVGIAPEDLPRLFQRFQRGRLTQRTEGLGLGLYIVRTLIEAHGGRVWVESVPGEGSTFAFTLPVAAS